MLAMHYFGEGEGTNFATAKEMGEPTARFYTERQQEIIWSLLDLIEVAFSRFALVQGFTPPADLQLETHVTEVARADNAGLASAAQSIAQAFTVAAAHGWIDDETALTLILKFAGENLPVETISAILERARAQMATKTDDQVANSVTTDETNPND